MKDTFAYQELNWKLIKHYKCFNTERFWLDGWDKDAVYIHAGIEDPCPVKFCRGIARFIKRTIKHMHLTEPVFIHVGPWAFKVSKL